MSGRFGHVRHLGLALALLGGAFVAYLPALNGEFLWDDDEYVSENPTLHDGTGLLRIWTEPGATPQYYPLVFTTFWLERRAWDLSTTGFHVVNVLLHALNAFLIFRLLDRLQVRSAAFAAAVFALHPVHVESVAWITERKNTLSLAFALGALLCLWTWKEKRGPWLYAAAVGLFIAGLLSKTVILTLPVVFLLLVWWREGRVARRDVLAMLPLLALSLAFGSITRWMETHHVGAKYVAFGLTPLDRALIAGRAVAFYAAKLLWPAQLTFIYPRWDIDLHEIWQFAFPAAVLLVLVLSFAFRERWGRGVFAGVLCFVVILLPVLGFVNFYPLRFSYVADHFVYHASLAVIVLATEALRRLALRVPRFPAASGAAVLVGVLGALTWARCQAFESPRALWTDTNEKNPNSQLVHSHLGVQAADEGRFDDAESHLRTSIRLDPKYENAYRNLGILLARQGRFDEAVPVLRRANELDPVSATASLTLGQIELTRSNPDSAVRDFEDALRRQPQSADAHYSLGIVLERKRDLSGAARHFRAALEIRPDFAEAAQALRRVTE